MKLFQTLLPILAIAGSAFCGEYDCDVAVIGGGSGGFGAALAAARLGCDVVLVEKADCLGGTSVRAGVNCWEMGAGGTGIPFDLYKELKRQPNAVSIYSFGRHANTLDLKRETFRYPGGETVTDSSRRYLDTLQRHVPRSEKSTPAYRYEHWHGLPFEPEAMAKTMRAMLDAAGHCRVMLNTAFVTAEASDGRVRSIQLSNGSRLRARHFIDATGDGLVCVAVGCKTMTGQEAREQFNEPDAPTNATARVNGVTLIYRATSVSEPRIEPLMEGIPAQCWWRKSFPGAHVNHYPNGDLNINMLPTMEGEEFMRLGYDAACIECERRVRAHWHDWQTRFEEFRRFRLLWIAGARRARDATHRRRICPQRERPVCGLERPETSRHHLSCRSHDGHPRRPLEAPRRSDRALRRPVSLPDPQRFSQPARGLSRGEFQFVGGVELPALAHNDAVGPSGRHRGGAGQGIERGSAHRPRRPPACRFAPATRPTRTSDARRIALVFGKRIVV